MPKRVMEASALLNAGASGWMARLRFQRSSAARPARQRAQKTRPARMASGCQGRYASDTAIDCSRRKNEAPRPARSARAMGRCTVSHGVELRRDQHTEDCDGKQSGDEQAPPRFGTIAQEHGCSEREGEEEGDVVEIEEARQQQAQDEPTRRADAGAWVARLEGNRERDEGNAGPPTVPANGGAPHQQLGMERREEQQADLRARASEERGDLQQKGGQAGVEEQRGKEIHPAEGRQDGVGKVGEQIHARWVEVAGGRVLNDRVDGREDEVERRDLVIVEIACGEQHHAKCSGDEQEGGGESARVWPEVRLRLRSGSAGHENEG